MNKKRKTILVLFAVIIAIAAILFFAPTILLTLGYVLGIGPIPS